MRAEHDHARASGVADISDGGRSIWLWISYVYAAIVVAGLGYFLLRIPIQLTDSFANMLALDQPLGHFIWGDTDDHAYMRQGLWVALKLVYDLAHGQYFIYYRLTQVIEVAAVLFLFVRLLRPRTPVASVALPVALAVLIGHHSFAWTVREAFPINTFLTILVCCVAAANLVFARPRLAVDVAALLLFVVAALTVESGLLVWVIVVAAYIVGARGVSGRGLVAMTAAIAGYFVLRRSLGIGVPDLLAREAGFGFTRYSAEALQAKFGANPYFFYAYNVLASVLGVLFSEPRDGVWRLVRAFASGTRDLPAVVNVVANVVATLLVGRYAWVGRHRWLARDLDHRDRLVLMFLAVLIANATMCYAYTKDSIMSPAAMFYAAAVFAATADLIDSLPRYRMPGVVLATVALVGLSTSWAVRSVGLHAALASTSLTIREQWAYYDEWAAPRGVVVKGKALALKQQLQDDAVVRHPARPPIRERWTALFDLE